MQAGIIQSIVNSFRTKCVKYTFCDISIRVTYEIVDIDVVLKLVVAWIIVLEKSNIHGRSLQIACKLR